jgi:integrase
MGEVNFYLKKKEPTTKKSLIYLQFKYNGIYKLTFSFNQSINPANWNKAKQRVKSNNQTTTDGQYSLNELMDNLEEICKKTYFTELKKGIPQPMIIKQKLLTFLNQNEVEDNCPTLFSLIERFINGDIKYRGSDKTRSTRTKYKTVLSYLRAFESDSRAKIDFDSINLDFFYRYVSFLRAKKLAQNTIAKNIQIIKVFMNEAVDLGYTTNMQFKRKKFSVSWEETDAVYLKDQEILKLFKLNLVNNNKLEQVRDLFVFGCYVGLRFSDFSNVKQENIIDIDGEKFINIKTMKTGQWVTIPCNPVVLEIFKKYEKNSNSLPKSISNQKFNDYIKEVCRLSGFQDKGRLQTEPEKELWQSISSHTARRSFASNLYLEQYPNSEIMKITGHKTEKAFLNYIKVSKLDAAKRLSKHFKKNWSEKLNKVIL